MSLLLLRPMPPDDPPPPPPPVEKTRNKTGIRAIFDATMDKRAKVTLERAIEILKAGW